MKAWGIFAIVVVSAGGSDLHDEMCWYRGGSISGKVKRASDQTPLTTHPVELYKLGSSERLTAAASEDGSFSFSGLSKGRYTLYIGSLDPEEVACSPGGVVSRIIDLEDNQVVSGADLIVEQAAFVSGTVVVDGQVAEGIAVAPSSQYGVPTKTDKEGKYRLSGLSPSETGTLRVRFGPIGDRMFLKGPITMAAGAETTGVNLDEKRADAAKVSISGKFLLKGNKVPEDSVVSIGVQGSTIMVRGSYVAAEDKFMILDLPAGTYSLTFAVIVGPDMTEYSRLQSVTVAGGNMLTVDCDLLDSDKKSP